jgi:uracil-DNA glycosylase
METTNNDTLWNEKLKSEYNKPYFQDLMGFVDKEREQFEIYPTKENVSIAFKLTPFKDVKVVLLGQDPYHGYNQAHGLCFSVSDGVKPPPSLINIFKELHNDIGCPIPNHGNLTKWAKQGVLLLNATLTVRARQAGSHQRKGWETFTDAVIKLISDEKEHCVFLLWGNYARSKAELIDRQKHLVLEAAHPSPLARGAFFGSKPFSQTNNYLMEHGKQPIDWDLSK